MERLNVRKLNEMGVIKQYQIKISHRSANLDESKDIQRAWKNNRDCIKISNKTV
jgi:hypothetical protein